MENKSFKLRFLELQNELKVSKDTFNTHGKFNYRTKPQILEVIKPIALKYGIIVTTTSNLIEVGTKVVNNDLSTYEHQEYNPDHTDIRDRKTLVNTEDKSSENIVVSRVFVNSKARATDVYSDEFIEAQAQAELQDKKGSMMNEPQLTGSSDSYAGKYALGNLFGIDDNNDPDSVDNTPKEKVTVKQPTQNNLTQNDNVLDVQALRRTIMTLKPEEINLGKVQELNKEIIKNKNDETALKMLVAKTKDTNIKYNENTKEWGE